MDPAQIRPGPNSLPISPGWARVAVVRLSAGFCATVPCIQGTLAINLLIDIFTTQNAQLVRWQCIAFACHQPSAAGPRGFFGLNPNLGRAEAESRQVQVRELCAASLGPTGQISPTGGPLAQSHVAP